VLTLPAVSLDILSADHHNGIKAKQNATEIIKLMHGGNGAQYFRRTQTKWQKLTLRRVNGRHVRATQKNNEMISQWSPEGGQSPGAPRC